MAKAGRFLPAAMGVAVALGAFLPAATAEDAACRERPACAGRVAERAPLPAQSRWTLDYSDAFSAGRLDMDSFDTFVVPLPEVEKAQTATHKGRAGSPVASLTCGRGKTLVCYTNCGAYEAGHWNEELLAPNRAALLGKPMAGYPEERWLDIRRLDAMRALVSEKFQRAARLGCQALVCDNTEAWITGTDGDGGAAIGVYRAQGLEALKRHAGQKAEERTGFVITYDDQIRFNRMLAEEAHNACLAIGLINDVFQIAELAGDFDFALNEQCHHCGWCDLYKPFAAAGKTVLHLEFADNEGFCGPGSAEIGDICRATAAAGLATFATVKRLASSKLGSGDRPEYCPVK